MKRILIINPNYALEIEIPLFGKIKFNRLKENSSIRGREYDGIIVDEFVKSKNDK